MPWVHLRAVSLAGFQGLPADPHRAPPQGDPPHLGPILNRGGAVRGFSGTGRLLVGNMEGVPGERRTLLLPSWVSAVSVGLGWLLQAEPWNPPNQQARGLAQPPGLGTTALCPGFPSIPVLPPPSTILRHPLSGPHCLPWLPLSPRTEWERMEQPFWQPGLQCARPAEVTDPEQVQWTQLESQPQSAPSRSQQLS